MLEVLELSDSDSEPLIRLIDKSVVEPMEPIRLSSPPLLGQFSPRSPVTISFEEQEDSLVPLSPNRVQAGRSQEMPAECSLFGVSPDTPGFVMRPVGAAPLPTGAISHVPSAFDGFQDPFFGSPIAFAQCSTVPGLDTPMTLPVYSMPPDANFMRG